VLSAFLGLLILNQFILYFSRNNNQQKNFPRKLLQYLDPIARWTYPDYKNLESNKKALFILGDSYAEGAGDLFLKDSYKYSVGHFLDNKWRKNANIYLVANSGSNIPEQLYLLENHLKGYSSNLTGTPIKSNNFNILLYFYEGNDLENTFISKNVSYQLYQSKLRFKLPILYAFRIANDLARKKLLSIFTRQLSLNKQNNLRNKICIDYICRSMPPLQTASAGLSDKQIINEIRYLEDSVKEFSLKYPNANMCLVYIPSPATIYSPKEDFYYQKYIPNKALKTDSKLNNKKSLLLRRILKNRLEFDFMTIVDSTKTFQKHARSGFIHGTLDPKHFNAYGYKLLADVTSQGCYLM